MPYYTNRQGVIPNQQIDDQPGWILVPNPPTSVPEGKELIWLNWEWVVRDRKPEPQEGCVWKFMHDEFKSNVDSNGWVKFVLPVPVPEEPVNESTESNNEPSSP